MLETETPPRLYGLPPIVGDRSKLLFLGSFPSVKSLEKQQYYGHPQNHFWLMMEQLFGIERSLSYEDRLRALLARGLAVWDVIADCRRRGSADHAIEDVTPNPLLELLTDHPSIRRVAFNGATAYETARLHVPELFERVDIAVYPLPSTSPRVPLNRKFEAWSVLKGIVSVG